MDLADLDLLVEVDLPRSELVLPRDTDEPDLVDVFRMVRDFWEGDGDLEATGEGDLDPSERAALDGESARPPLPFDWGVLERPRDCEREIDRDFDFDADSDADERAGEREADLDTDRSFLGDLEGD